MIQASTNFSVPDGADRLSVQIYTKDTTARRDVLISCRLDTSSSQNLDIQNWPRYPRTGLPSKYLREGSAGALLPLADITLPPELNRHLTFSIESRRKRRWMGWAVAITSSAAGTNSPTTWVREFKEQK